MSPATRRRGFEPHAVLVAVVAILLFANTLRHEFVYDDLDYIVGNPWLRDVSSIRSIFTSAAWEFAGQQSYYRPLTNLLYLAIAQAFGLAPFAFHAVAVLLHATCAVLVLWAVREQEPRTSLAGLAGALLFAAHPTHTESIAWVSGMQDALAAAFILGAWLLHARERRIAGAALFLCGALTKETALVLPLLLACGDRTAGRLGSPASAARRYLPYAVAGALYLVARLAALDGAGVAAREDVRGVLALAANALFLFARYLAKLVVPYPLNAAYEYVPLHGLAEPRALLGLLVAIAFGVAVAVAVRRRSASLVGLAWIALTILPALYLPALGEHPFADRYLYMPSIGLGWLASLGLARLAGRWPVAGRGALVAVLLVITAFSGLTIVRNRVWRDELALWTDTARRSPGSWRVHNNLGYALGRAGRATEAQRELQAALRLNPDAPLALINMGNLLLDAGRFAAAVGPLERAVAVDPDSADARNDLGRAYAGVGQGDRAIEMFRSAIRLPPGHANARNNLGLLLLQRGRVAEAVLELEASVAAVPDDPDRQYNLAVAYAESRREQEAIAQLQQVLRARPEDPEARSLLGRLSRTAR